MPLPPPAPAPAARREPVVDLDDLPDLPDIIPGLIRPQVRVEEVPRPQQLNNNTRNIAKIIISIDVQN